MDYQHVGIVTYTIQLTYRQMFLTTCIHTHHDDGTIEIKDNTLASIFKKKDTLTVSIA